MSCVWAELVSRLSGNQTCKTDMLEHGGTYTIRSILKRCLLVSCPFPARPFTFLESTLKQVFSDLLIEIFGHPHWSNCKDPFNKYTIRSIVCEASCYSVTRSLGHSVTLSLGHSVTGSLGHSVTWSLNHSITWSLSHSVTLFST